MKRLVFFVGVGIGFVLGSRAGREMYNHIEAKVREMTGRPAGPDVVDQVSGAVKEHAPSAQERVVDTPPSSSDNRSPHASSRASA